MQPLPFDYSRCEPEEPDQYCKNCKRWSDHPEQTFGEYQPFVTVKNSRSESCIYIPISLQSSPVRSSRPR